MVTLRITCAKYQPPRPKTVAYRRITDRHTHRQTDRRRKQTLKTPLFEIFFLFSIFFKRSGPKRWTKKSLSTVKIISWSTWKYRNVPKNYCYFLFHIFFSHNVLTDGEFKNKAIELKNKKTKKQKSTIFLKI